MNLAFDWITKPHLLLSFADKIIMFAESVVFVTIFLIGYVLYAYFSDLLRRRKRK